MELDDIITKVEATSTEIQSALDGDFYNYTFAALLRTVLQGLRDDNSDLPFILKARKCLSEIQDVNTRKHVTYELEKKLRSNDNYMGLRALVNYHNILDEVIYSNELQDKYNQECKGDVIAHDTSLYYVYIGKNQLENHKEFLSFSQALYFFSHKTSELKLDASQLPLYSYFFKDLIIAFPITEFCKSLLEAEHYRRKVCQKTEVPPVTVKDFPIYLRQHCEFCYLQYRTNEEHDILLQNNDRSDAATKEQAQEVVLRKEYQAFNEAYAKNVDEDILKMTAHFINHVKKVLGIYVKEERSELAGEDFNIPNLNNDIDRRIKAVYKARICKRQADWAAVYKLLVEEGVYTMIEYAPGATRINNACGKKVTTSRAIMQSAALDIIDGKWKEGGWRDRVHNKTSGNLMNRYMAIARAFYQ